MEKAAADLGICEVCGRGKIENWKFCDGCGWPTPLFHEAPAEVRGCSICGLNLNEAALYFSIARQGKAICADCVREMFPSRMPEKGITIQWQFK